MTAAAVLAQAGMWLAAFVVGGLIGRALRRAVRRRAIRRRPVWTDDVVVNGQRVGVVRVEGRVSAEEAQRIRKAFIAANISRPDLEFERLKALADVRYRFYGDGGTIHSTGYVDVEVHDGQVVAVWFRCQMLPFKTAAVDAERARVMLGARVLPSIAGVVFVESPRSAL